MPTWLKSLVLIAMLLVGAPAASYAHGSEEHAPQTTAHAASSNRNENVQPSALYFEQSSMKFAGPCSCDCCCAGGTMHCSSGGAAVFSNGQNSVFPKNGGEIVPVERPQMHAATMIFGLERPPKG